MLLNLYPRASRRYVMSWLSIATLCGSAAFAQDCDRFERIPTPNSGTDANVLLGVAAVSDSDAWAVGYLRQGVLALPLSLRYNGTQWASVSMPLPPGASPNPGVTLTDARAFSADDVWAVGSSSTGQSVTTLQTLAYRWNGSAWSVVPSPIGCCAPIGSAFFSVDGVSGSDFWAVGDIATSSTTTQILAAHWNGSAWQEFRLPRVAGGREAIKDLHVLASNDVWALEGTGIFSPSSPRRILRWNGSAWSEGAPALNPARYTAAEAIHVFGPSDIWVSSVVDGTFQVVMLHWNGSSWTEFNVPVLAYQFFADAPNDLYAVGYASMMRWNGTSWSVVQSIPAQGQINFFDTERAADGTVWSAGSVQPGSTALTLSARLEPCPICLADFNGDSVVNSLDYIDFASAFFMLLPAADVNRDGSINTADFFTFVDALFVGC